MKELTTHVEDIENYENIIEHLGNVNFLDPKTTNNQLATLKSQDITKANIDSKKPAFLWQMLKLVLGINSIFPLLIYKSIEPKIQEAEFVSTTKLAIGITAFPLFYGLQTVFVHYFFGLNIAFIYLTVSVLSIFILVKTK